MKTLLIRYLLFLIISYAYGGTCGSTQAQGLEVSAGADLMSRYIWRGLDVGDAFSVQPSLEFKAGGWNAGFWGSYSSEFDEVDTWMSYTVTTTKVGSFTALVTDYYLPSSGIRFFNFNNYDDPDGAGAHLLELGISWSGPATFPLTLSGYVNIHNEPGNCTYFQADYATKVQDIDLGFSIGATPGSTEHPVFYGSDERPVDDLQVIYIGLKATRAMKLWQENSLPLSVAFVLNPQQEQSYLVLGVSL